MDTSKIYTAINADELKPGDKVIVADTMTDLRNRVEENNSNYTREIMRIGLENTIARFVVTSLCDTEGKVCYSLAYLVEHAKEEKKGRPYENCAEMIADYKKRFNVNCTDIERPSIWIKSKESGIEYLINVFAEAIISFAYYSRSLDVIFEHYTYLDGTPCGMEE